MSQAHVVSLCLSIHLFHVQNYTKEFR